MNSRSIIKEVCPTSTLELIKRGYLLLDVRENNEVQELAFDISGLIHIPLSELEERHLEIPKDEIIIVACRTGERSYRAIEYLREIGLTNLLNMKKGLVKWVQKGFPTKGDTSSIPLHTCSRGFHC